MEVNLKINVYEHKPDRTEKMEQMCMFRVLPAEYRKRGSLARQTSRQYLPYSSQMPQKELWLQPHPLQQGLSGKHRLPPLIRM